MRDPLDKIPLPNATGKNGGSTGVSLEQQKSQLEHERQTQAQDIGHLGKLFGGKENAAPYLFAILFLSGLTFLAIIAYHEPSVRPDIGKGLFIF